MQVSETTPCPKVDWGMKPKTLQPRSTIQYQHITLEKQVKVMFGDNLWISISLNPTFGPWKEELYIHRAKLPVNCTPQILKEEQ